jgi:hypothetical protein
MLERSRMSDLVIEMDFWSSNCSDRKDILNRIKQVIIDHGNRIREIQLSRITSAELKALLDSIPDSSLRLTSLLLMHFQPLSDSNQYHS